MRKIWCFILLSLLYGMQLTTSTDNDSSNEIDYIDSTDVTNSTDKSSKCVGWGTGGIPSVPSADIPTEPLQANPNMPSKLRQRNSRQRSNAYRRATVAPKTSTGSSPTNSVPAT
ncbi:hypothetical protein ACKWTF_009640 [Chironomus riparius]